MNYELIKLITLARYGSVSQHPLLAGVESELKDSVARRFCYSSRYRFTYLRIPKSANSTIVRTLVAHMPDVKLRRSILLGRTRWKNHLRRLPSEAQFQASFSFSFVRDPAARVLSAYLDKVCFISFARKHGLEDPRHPGRPVRFPQFLDRLEADLLYRDLHWAPQSTILPLKGAPFTFIGRVEHFDRDIQHVMNTIFGRFSGINRRNSGVTNAADKKAAFISADDQRRIEKLYAADYELYYSDCA